MIDIKAGDVVSLRSGGELMVVISIDDHGTYREAHVAWSVEGSPVILRDKIPTIGLITHVSHS